MPPNKEKRHAMDPHAAEPTIIGDPQSLYLAYRMREGGVALVRFGGVAMHSFGPPSPDEMETHILYSLGLDALSFVEVEGSPCVRDLTRPEPGMRHWIITFPEGTFEVLATSANAVRIPQAESPLSAVAAVLNNRA